LSSKYETNVHFMFTNHLVFELLFHTIFTAKFKKIWPKIFLCDEDIDKSLGFIGVVYNFCSFYRDYKRDLVFLNSKCPEIEENYLKR